MTDYTDAELLAQLGVEFEEKPIKSLSIEQERVNVGFDEITEFFKKNNRLPRHDDHANIFERIYAVRLDCLRKSEHWRQFLSPYDACHLLDAAGGQIYDELAALDDNKLLRDLGISLPNETSIETLKHVRPQKERKQENESATRKAAVNFAQFKPLFSAIQKALEQGARRTLPFVKDSGVSKAEIKQGQFFILNGLIAYVGEVGPEFRAPNGELDARLRVIFSNATESDMLLRSLQRALYKDEHGQRISEPEAGPLFATPCVTGFNNTDDMAAKTEKYFGEHLEPDDLPTGQIYVLRSLSDYPFIKENREVLHKIGVTGRPIKNRIANAKLDPTYLMADVEVVASYQLYNINRVKLENLLHRVFASAKCDFEIKDRFGHPIHPNEWFLVPLAVIDDAVERIKDGTLQNYIYLPKEGRLVQMNT